MRYGSTWDTSERSLPAAPRVSALHKFGNYAKTAALLAAMTALVLVIGQKLGGATGLLFASIFVVVMNFGTWWFSDKLALAMHGAKPVSRAEAPWLHEMVERLAERARVPKPAVYLIPTANPNAFATGRSPSHAAVAVTSGIVDILDRRELEAVLAHEIGHVVNRDTLISTVAATLAGVISYAAQMLFFFGGSFLRSSDDDEGDGIAGALGSLGLLIVAPIAATILQLAISRSREYGADATGAELSRDPLALASALGKLARGAQAIPYDRAPATAHLFIVNPLSGGAVMKLFSTHPPMEERIKRLHGMAR